VLEVDIGDWREVGVAFRRVSVVVLVGVRGH
jgi:hypothetical protein